jgi:bacillithiol synthase
LVPTSLSAAYLAAEESARRFLPEHYRDPAARRTVAQRSADRAVAPALVAALRAQNSAYAPSAARERHCDALAAPGTAVVVTGQQTGLLLGPLYTLYKAASVVVTARAIERESGVRCVPLFWLQTEDHDFAEIARCHVLHPGAPPLELELADDDHALARVSVAHRRLGPEVTALLDRLQEALGGLPHGAAALALLRAHYWPGQSIGAAFAGLLADLFSEEGLLLLDPRQGPVARLATPIYRAALQRSDEIAAALVERTRALRAAGFDEQVPVRPEASLLFFHQESRLGPRYRLAGAGSVRHLLGASGMLAEAELLDLLEADPLRFSSSALLRPLVQDHLLPTAAYVAGPHETNYLAQLGPLYELLGLSQPLVVPRARFRCLEARTRALLGRLGLQPADAEAPRAELLRRLAATAAPGPGPAEALAARLRDALSGPLDELQSAEPSLRDPVQKARVYFERTIARLAGRHAAALLERDRVAGARVDRLQAFLCPQGTPQERYFSLPYFACQHGTRAFAARVLASVTPFDAEPRDLDL